MSNLPSYCNSESQEQVPYKCRSCPTLNAYHQCKRSICPRRKMCLLLGKFVCMIDIPPSQLLFLSLRSFRSPLSSGVNLSERGQLLVETSPWQQTKTKSGRRRNGFRHGINTDYVPDKGIQERQYGFYLGCWYGVQ